jgi:hypothetical protein
MSLVLVAGSAPLLVLAGVAESHAATNAMGAATVQGATLTAGSSGNDIVILVSALGETQSGVLSIRIPKPANGVPWSTPQKSDPLGQGYVSRSVNGCTVRQPKVNGTAPGPFTIKLTYSCPQFKTFDVAYSNVTAPTLAQKYKFASKVKPDGSNAFVSTQDQPATVVKAGAASKLNVAAPAMMIPTGVIARENMSVRAVDTYGNIVKSVNGTATLSYQHTCADEEWSHLGVEPSSITLTKGSGTQVWDPPFMSLIPGVTPGTCYNGTHQVQAITTVKATLGGLQGQGSNRVRVRDPLAGYKLASQVCDGGPGWIFTDPGTGDQFCMAEIQVSVVTGDSGTGFTLNGVAINQNSQPIAKVTAQTSSLIQGPIVIDSTVEPNAAPATVASCEAFNENPDIGDIDCNFYETTANLEPTAPVMVDASNPSRMAVFYEFDFSDFGCTTTC